MSVNDMDMKSVVVANRQQVSGDLGEEAVILSLEDGMYYGVNTVGSRIWSEIQQPRTLQQLLGTLTDEFEVDPDECLRDLKAFLQQLADKGLVQVQG
jgi:hypothetical protein